MRLCARASAAMRSSSVRVNTFPTGLCGVLSTIIFVRGLTARLRRVDATRQSPVPSSPAQHGATGDSLELVKVDGPGALADRDAGRGLGARVEGHVDALAALEGDGGEVLVEEGLEDDDLVAGLDERGERGVLAWKRAPSALVKLGRSTGRIGAEQRMKKPVQGI